MKSLKQGPHHLRGFKYLKLNSHRRYQRNKFNEGNIWTSWTSILQNLLLKLERL
jgi:hypothetical protein